MIRTLDASDFIEPKKKRLLCPVSSSSFTNLSNGEASPHSYKTELRRSRELFGIKGLVCQKAKGTVIYREGEVGNNFYLLQKGALH